ncbi:MAG TPA: glycosyltransferase family 4 protein [Chitinispirillaceae bacterium]|nr:glycosyltransferase family 4 protein [Chitinispirillaceae bacterium]
MKIALLNTLYPPLATGGAEFSVFSLAGGLAKAGNKVIVITIGREDSISDEHGVKCYRCRNTNVYHPADAKKNNALKKLPWHLIDLYNVAAAKQVEGILNKEKPDVLHCHNIDGFSCLAWSVCNKLKIPVIQHFHDYHFVCFHADLLRKNLQECQNLSFACKLRSKYHALMMSRYVNHIVSPSQYCYTRNMAYLNEKTRELPFSIIPNGTDFNLLEPVLPDWDADEFNILYLGRLAANKGVNVLLEAMEKLATMDMKIKLNIAGSGPLENNVKVAAQNNRNLIYHGFVQNESKIALFRRAHFMIFPSIWNENNPVAVTEALAIGLPVIGSNLGGTPELLDTYGEVALLKEVTSSSIVEKIKLLYKERDFLKNYGRHVLAKREKYSLTGQISSTCELYKTVINQ